MIERAFCSVAQPERESMETDHATLSRLISFLRSQPGVADKLRIDKAYEPARSLASAIAVGDDCAAIPDGDGFLLLAAEGMLDSFVADDPWFAGYSAVMVNLSDVAAMGGRPIAVVDVLWTPGPEESSLIWDGIAAASRAYGVPVVGGHTTMIKSGTPRLAAAVLGRTKRLITSFDAHPGDDLLMAVDLRGSYRRDKPFWNASVGAPSMQLRQDLELFATLGERGWCKSGKDISNGGVIGTLAMLLQCSRVGAELWLDQIPRPGGADLGRWLISFPSFGFLLSVAPEATAQVVGLFSQRDIACTPVGKITDENSFVLSFGQAQDQFSIRN